VLNNQYSVLYPGSYITLFVFTELAEEFLNDYAHITVGSTDLVANHDITQIIEVCLPADKPTM